MFNIYQKCKIQNIELWNVIYCNFVDFKKEYWNLISSNFWNLIHKMCYTQKFWIDRINDKDNITSKYMNVVIHRDYYDDWLLKQIKWVKKYYKRFFSIVQDRKNDLLEIFNKLELFISLSSSVQLFTRSLSSSIFDQTYLDIRNHQNFESWWKSRRNQYEKRKTNIRRNYQKNRHQKNRTQSRQFDYSSYDSKSKDYSFENRHLSQSNAWNSSLNEYFASESFALSRRSYSKKLTQLKKI